MNRLIKNYLILDSKEQIKKIEDKMIKIAMAIKQYDPTEEKDKEKLKELFEYYEFLNNGHTQLKTLEKQLKEEPKGVEENDKHIDEK